MSDVYLTVTAEGAVPAEEPGVAESVATAADQPLSFVGTVWIGDRQVYRTVQCYDSRPDAEAAAREVVRVAFGEPLAEAEWQAGRERLASTAGPHAVPLRQNGRRREPEHQQPSPDGHRVRAG